MQADDALRSIPVVVMSEEGSRTRINDLIQKGVRAYLRKPFTPEAVKAIVESVLGEQHA
jgi:two-component system chemotaxis response regulator CheY